ncbi:uncharacterized protein LAESUDRAFT_87374 [Laetiporus sulphureus 93-53]|uniref:Uncharacterized protein n=1 Tax=Laetiporus sulphureus 93-53 TaxID=1314785 RepID=A0A165EW14_9APHY|nr:uncharacterized protein LAESUDRAFT_87374 [Laetiporus sulphureus 93-53]KZT07886.1 hypothetical protein LAESUDRAFT_87374 [Laetiporus sulphureus 93-53]
MNFKAILAWARSVEATEQSPSLYHPRPQQTWANFADILDGERQVSNYAAEQYIAKKDEHIFSQTAAELCDALMNKSLFPSKASSSPVKHPKSWTEPKELLSVEDFMHCLRGEVKLDIQKPTKEIAYEVFADTETANWKRLCGDNYEERKKMAFRDPNCIYEWPPITPGMKAAMDPTVLNTDLANTLVGDSLLSMLDADGTWDDAEGEREGGELQNGPQAVSTHNCSLLSSTHEDAQAQAGDICTDIAIDVAQMHMAESGVEKSATLLPKEDAATSWPNASSFPLPGGSGWYDIAGYGSSVWARTASELPNVNLPASATSRTSSPSLGGCSPTTSSFPMISSIATPSSPIDIEFQLLDGEIDKERRLKWRAEAAEELTSIFKQSEPSPYGQANLAFARFPSSKAGKERWSDRRRVPVQIVDAHAEY